VRAPRGQNFLFQSSWLERIAGAVGESRSPAPDDGLIEIGGGPGGLTALLAAQTERFWVVESDRRLAEGLRQRFGETVIEADVLTLDLTALAEEKSVGRWQVAGNLPYYITSPILLHLFRHAARIREAVLMTQREVAERLVAKPGRRAFGLLSATTQFYAQAERLFDLPPGAFRPAPKVYSSLVRLTFAPRGAELGVDEAAFMAFLRRAFAHKRKTLRHMGIDSGARAEQLTLDEMAELHRQMTGTPQENRTVE